MNNAESSTNKSFQIVAAMNLAFNNPAGIRTAPDFKRTQKQCKNIGDEINELQTAMDAADLDKVRDALCDICVFAYGAHHFVGIAGWEVRVTNAPASLPEFVKALHTLKLRFEQLMNLFEANAANNTLTAESIAFYLDDLVNISAGMLESLGADHDTDMKAVIDGVMTRFIKDDADKEATIAKHAAKGVTEVYFEGEYPTMIMKSSVDQPDAPKGKFLKSASFREAIFASIEQQPFHVHLVAATV